jgi:alanine-glyoxylate transaminase / serine-glyoxylate transaminase / serine-pyruvate transaminase
MRAIFKTEGPVVIYPASGTGAWEAALVNTLSPGDRVLMYETGHFAALWKSWPSARARAGIHRRRLAQRRRPAADRGPARRRRAARHQGRLRRPQRDLDRLTSRHRRGAQGDRRAGHPALLMVDTISSLASIDYRHDEWGVDVTVAGSQKGLMLPPGPLLQRRQRQGAGRAGSRGCRAPTGTGRRCSGPNETGYFPYTPATNLLYGLAEAIDMLTRRASTTSSPATTATPRRPAAAVRAWGLEVLCWRNPRHYSAR